MNRERIRLLWQKRWVRIGLLVFAVSLLTVGESPALTGNLFSGDGWWTTFFVKIKEGLKWAFNWLFSVLIRQGTEVLNFIWVQLGGDAMTPPTGALSDLVWWAQIANNWVPLDWGIALLIFYVFASVTMHAFGALVRYIIPGMG